MKKLDAIVIVIGAGVWGAAETLSEARKNAKNPKQFIAYLAPKGTRVTDMGCLSWREAPDSFEPFVIEKKVVSK